MSTSAPARVAINGLGRVGRAFLKLALARPELDVVAINELGNPESIAYLMRFDSVYGRYDRPVAWHDDGQPGLSIADRRIAFLRQPDPAQLPWGALNIDIVVEATGVFETYAKARSHLKAGAHHVVLAAPAKDEDEQDARTVLMGVNAGELRGATMTSNGSCTTNSASPVIQILNEAIGVRKAFLNTVHAYTATQSLVDSPVKRGDVRRGRAAATSIIPATTGAVVAVGRAIPAVRNRFDGLALRVPVLTGSLSSIVCLAARETSAAEINDCFEQAVQQPRWRSILAVTRDPIVSADIVGDPHAAIIDLSLTKVVDGDLCCVYSWYDNEFGYTNSLLQHVIEVAAQVRQD